MELWYHHDDTAYSSRVDLAAALASGSIIAGSPETVRRSLLQSIEVSGADRINCCFAFGSLTAEAVERSLRLFSAEVMASL